MNLLVVINIVKVSSGTALVDPVGVVLQPNLIANAYATAGNPVSSLLDNASFDRRLTT